MDTNMMDVSKRLSGSPTVPTKPNLAKKWVSEPSLLSDDPTPWIREKDNMEENGVSFTDEVPQLRLANINKQKVQLRPRRRPPSRDFVRSRASMDFDLAVHEEIKEEDEDGLKEDDDKQEEQDIHTPLKPISPPKPDGHKAWKLPAIGSEVTLKHHTAESKENDATKASGLKVPGVEEKSPSKSPGASPANHKERKRFKVHLFKFRRSRKEKSKGKDADYMAEKKSNLTEIQSKSVDSGTRPLGEETPGRWPQRRRRQSDETKGLSWLLGLFQRRNTSEMDEKRHAVDKEKKTSIDPVGNGKDTKEANGLIPEIKVDSEANNDGSLNENLNGRNPSSVSDLKQKFERISAAF